MTRDRTIERVIATLTSQLLPMEGLREIAAKKPLIEVELDELLAEKTEEQFVIASYQSILGRRPEQEGISNWLGHLQNGSLTRVEMVRQLVASDEGKARQVFVPGLSMSKSANNTDIDATDTKGEKSLWKMGRKNQKSDSLEKATAATIDRAIKNVEGQIQELAQQCLHVVEHIEHRFSKFPLPKLAAPTPPQFTFEPTRESDEDRILLLYETLRSRTSQMTSSQIKQAISEMHRIEVSDSESMSGLKGWVFAGDDVLDLVAECVSKNIPVLGMLTSSLCVGFARFLGVHAVEQSVDVWMTSCASHAAQVVWLRDRLRLQSDSDLLRCLKEMERVVTKGGYLIVDEPIDANSFASMRLISAIEVSGFKQDTGEVAKCLNRCEGNSLSSAIVFRKNADSEGCT